MATKTGRSKGDSQHVGRKEVGPPGRQVGCPQEAAGVVIDRAGQTHDGVGGCRPWALAKDDSHEVDESLGHVGVAGRGRGTALEDVAVRVHQRRAHLGAADVGCQDQLAHQLVTA